MDAVSSSTVLAAWHQEGAAAHAPGDYVGLIELDWQAAQVRIRSALAVPTRTHALLVQPDGGFVAVAVRPGAWIVRCDAQGQDVQWLRMDSESEGRTLDGHVCASADGQWLYTAETHPRSGQGWISVRDRQTLRKVAQWRLKDQRQGMRHMAWSHPEAARGSQLAPAKPLLGIALQNEHDDVIRRRASPVLAVWNGETLNTPAPGGDHGGGYSGDIVGTPDGGFALSCLRTGTALRWSPSAPSQLTVIAQQLKDAGAMTRWPLPQQADGLLLGSAHGVARWHPEQDPVFLKWPNGLALDNHWALVG